MKLWDKGIPTNEKIDQFTVGNDRELDLLLAKYDVIASIAHANMLAKVGLISIDEGKALVHELKEIGKSIKKGSFTIETDFEDMHSKIEFLLIQKLGDTGKKIHSARSRNDQVLVAMHLYLKNEIQEIKDLVKSLFDLLIELADKHKTVLLPGYTHLQIAMPSSFGLWFSAYAESLVDDVYLLNAAYKIADQNPLGSAAGYGSSFPIDREFTTAEMNFDTLKYNVVAAQMSRGKVEKTTAFGMSSVAATLSKLAMDICLYMSQNFNFISFPDALTTGSSIMPHKKNPDVFELIRAKCNKIQAIPAQLIAVTNNLPSGYHRDLQLVKEIIVPAIQELKSCLEILAFSLKEIKVNQEILEDPKYDYLFSVDTLNELVLQGMPFREAYKKMGAEIQSGIFKPKRDIKHTHLGSLGNLGLQGIKTKMSKAL
ncbi:argininosuccinate lyase [Ascidiimonas sp. W6]|uniref:argininosuccinate lyase n=1 Tax=Ascidiimonas meishanensis TaxID=3128903 RepID=UPI0030EC1E8B